MHTHRASPRLLHPHMMLPWAGAGCQEFRGFFTNAALGLAPVIGLALTTHCENRGTSKKAWGFRALGFRALGFRALGFKALRFRALGFRALGFRALGFRALGFRALGFRALGFRALGFKALRFRALGLGLWGLPSRRKWEYPSAHRLYSYILPKHQTLKPEAPAPR